MDNKNDVDRLIYLLSQEDAVAELDKINEPHDFSAKYRKHKMSLINSVSGKGVKFGRGMVRKKVIILVAAVTATLAITVTAYGVCRNFFITDTRDEEEGSITYNVKSSSGEEVKNIPLINITPGYLPDGYLPLANAPGKYTPGGEPGNEEILIYQNEYVGQPTSGCVSSSEDTVIGGIKAKINISNGSLLQNSIDLIYEDDGQIITIGGTVSLEELKKVAESIKYEIVPGEFLETYIPEADTSSEDTYLKLSVPADHIRNLGEEMGNNTMGLDNIIYTLSKVEIMDKLPELDKNNFWDYNEYLDAVNEDGTIKDYERSVSIKWENNELSQVTESASRRFACVTLLLRNPSDREIKQVGVYPIIEYRKKAADGSLQAFPDDSRGGNEIANSKEAIYFDRSDYSGKGFFFCDFDANESKEVHLIYLLDEDHIDDAYFTQRGISIANGVPEIGDYVKIK